MDEVRRIAREHKPKLIIAGATAYPRHWDFAAEFAPCRCCSVRIFRVGSRIRFCESTPDQNVDVDGGWNADVGWWEFAAVAGACRR